ncbi:MAG: DUF438 domain-containing protein [Spirochaetales bacterium]|nr:DUF438 domain-containing protein [Spirochaetales bacterium]
MSEHLAVSATKQDDLKQVIRKLHGGATVDEVRREFAKIIKGVGAEEIAAMEQALVNEGFPVQEIQRLCDVHVEVFRAELGKGKKAASLPGHPVRTFLDENLEARKRVRNLTRAARAWSWRADSSERLTAFRESLDALEPILVHFARKENQLFPWLEKHGFTGPSKVMWGKHDEIRAAFKEARAALASSDARSSRAAARDLARRMRVMFFMEEKILYPTALARLAEAEWARIRMGEDAIGYAWVKPGAVWDAGLVLAAEKAAGRDAGPTPDSSYGASGAKAAPGAKAAAREAAPVPTGGSAGDGGVSDGGAGGVELSTGALPLEVLDRILTSLPVDISFVDANDRVLYYSDSLERVFPRSPAIIGREVRNCHPPKSVAAVERILDDFKHKRRDRADFWIRMGPRFVVIQYKPVYGADGSYLGTLEMSMDASWLRGLEGEQRLLE